jgi:hypothetical protein
VVNTALNNEQSIRFPAMVTSSSDKKVDPSVNVLAGLDFHAMRT